MAPLLMGSAGLKDAEIPLVICRVDNGEIAAGRPPTEIDCSDAGIAGPGREVFVGAGNAPCAGGLTQTC